MKDTGLRLTVSAVTVDAPEPASCSVRDESYGIAPHRLCCGRAGAGLLLGA